MMQPGTKLGIAAAQLAQQGQYKPFTSDGKPTVVNNIITQETQKEAAQQAQIAGQIQAERERKMAEAIRQMAAQQATQGQGIAGLPADVNMAEGGIVGYSGVSGESLVKNLSIDEINRMSPEMRKAYFKEIMERRNAAAPTPTSGGAAPVGSGSLGGAFRSGLARFAPLAFLTDLFTTSDEDVALLKKAEAERGAASAVDTLKGRPRGQADYGVEDLSPPQEIRDLLAKYPGQGRRGPAAEVKPTGQSGIAQTRPTQTAPAAPMLPDTRESTAVNPSRSDLIYAQQTGALRELAERLGKPIQKTPEELAYQKAVLEEYKRGIGAIDAAEQRFAAMQKTRDSRNLADFLSAAGGAGSMFSGLSEAQKRMSPILAAREEQALAYKDKLGERRNAVEAFRLASVKQDADSAKAAAERLRTIDLELNKLGLGLGEARMKELSALERTQAEIAGRAAEGERDRASREKIEGQKLKLQAEQNGQIQLATRLNAANTTVSAAVEKMERALDKKYGATAQLFRMLPKSEIDKKPELAASYAEYKKESEKMFAEMVEPAIAERNRLAAQIGGTNIQRYDTQGNLVKQ